jgi:hypothetical protein
VRGLLQERVNVTVSTGSQEEVDLHYGVYERMLTAKLRVVPPIRGAPASIG